MKQKNRKDRGNSQWLEDTTLDIIQSEQQNKNRLGTKKWTQPHGPMGL